MKQGLSLRVSQHLALTPQLQQSIRLLQLSTLELSQEVERGELEQAKGLLQLWRQRQMLRDAKGQPLLHGDATLPYMRKCSPR